MFRLLPVIRKNVEAFGSAIAKNGGTGRSGTNIGVLLACAWALRSDAEITEAQAVAHLKKHQWIAEAIGDSAPVKEWERIFGHLGQHRVDINLHREWHSIPLRECVGMLAGIDPGYAGCEKDVRDALGRMSIKVEGHGQFATVALGHGSNDLKAAMKGSPWQTGWVSTLEAVPGATKKRPRFTATLQDRAIVVPAHLFLGLDAQEAVVCASENVVRLAR